MGLWYQNGYTDPVYVAMLWFDSGCSGQPWRKSGWYLVAPGSSVEIVGANLKTIPDSNFAWFAQADWADGPCWSGDPAHNWYAIPHNAAFNQCYLDNSGCNAAYPFNAGTLGRSSIDWTIVLLQSGVAGRGFQGCSYGMAGQPTAHLLNSPSRRSSSPIGAGRRSRPARPTTTTAPARSPNAKWSMPSSDGLIAARTPVPLIAMSPATLIRR